MTRGERTAFDDDGSLRDLRFDDLFQPLRDGPEQAGRDAEIVYLDGSGILRGEPTAAPETETVRVGELGFGTGLNFLLCWQRFRERSADSATLIYNALEAFPLSRGTLERALTPFSGLAPLRAELIAHWPSDETGVHTLILDGGRVRLTLLFGDALTMLERHSFRCAHWILDGFSPAKNPELWSQEIFEQLRTHSTEDARLGTYTIARSVREHLTATGFAWERCPGVGAKRDRIEARLERTPEQASWNDRLDAATPTRVRILGAGLAGCATAYALSRRGIDVEIVDPHGVAGGASGQRQAVFQPRLGGTDAPDARFVAQAYAWTRALLIDLDPEQELWSPCGVAHPARDERAKEQTLKRLELAGLPGSTARWIDPNELGDRCGRRLDALGALFLPQAGILSPRRLCERLLELAGIKRVHAVSSGADCELQILANGHHAMHPGREWLGLRPTRGQTSLIRPIEEPSEIVLCDGGYVTPPFAGSQALGATYGHGDDRSDLRDDDDQENIDRSRARFPELGITADAELCDREAGVRATTADRFPIVGRLPDTGAFDRGEAPRFQNLAVQTGHGSRGSMTAPFCGEILAAELTGEALPVSDDLRRRLAPLRTFVRYRQKNPGSHRPSQSERH